MQPSTARWRRGALACALAAGLAGPARAEVRIVPLPAPPASESADPGDLLGHLVASGGRTSVRVVADAADANRFLAGGWSPPERWGDPPVARRWSIGPDSRLRFEAQRIEPLLLTLRIVPYQPPGGRAQEVRVWLNGSYLAAIELEPRERSYELVLPAGGLQVGTNVVRFAYLWTERPALGDAASADSRPLAIALSELEIRPLQGAAEAEGALVSVSTPARPEPFRGYLPPAGRPVSVVVWPPPGSTLELGWLQAGDARPAAALRVEAESDRGRSVLLERPARRGVVESARLALPAGGDGPLRLHFAVSGDPDARLVWLEPRVVPPGAPAPPAPLRVAPGTNLVVVVLDAAARDRFSAYGRPTRTTPLFERLAEESIVFDAAYASATHTLPSTASLFTSRLPPEHGALDDRFRLGPEWPTLAELLARQGYATAVFSANPFVSTDLGTTRGFAEIVELFRGKGPGEVARGADFLPPVRAFLEAHRDRPFFAYVHVVQPHEPYDAAPDDFYAGRLDPAYAGRIDGSQPQIWEVFRRRLFPTDAELAHIRGLYEGNLAYADSVMGEICRAIGETGLWGETIVVVTADHGEALGEHGSWGHGEGVTREQIAIPLLVRLPPGVLAPGRRGDLVSSVDLMPSVLELLGIEPPPGLRGRSWFAPRSAREWPSSVLSVAQGETGIVSVLAPGFKYSHDPLTGAEQLLALPAEEAGPNLRWERPVTFAYLAQEALRLQARGADAGAAPAPDPLPADVQEALKALGYVE